MNFFCIADSNSSLGFRLVGVDTREVSTRNETLEALKVALAKENVGVILVTQKVASFIRQEMDSLIYKRELPLILEIPSRGVAREKKSVSEVLKKAIGITI